MLAPVTHILPLTLIRRQRLLPIPGRVTVRAGQRVGPTDTLAETNLNAEYLLIDVARGLGVPPEKADKHLQCQAGDTLAEKDIIAGPVGLFRRVVRCPHDARVALAGSGQVLLEITSKPYQLKASIPGEVVELYHDLGVAIEVSGALLQGVWGNGKMDYGVLTVLAHEPLAEITPQHMDVSLRGSIVMAGYASDPEVLRSAEELPLRGLVLSSARAALVPKMLEMAIPVMLLEGFGELAYSQAAFQLLQANDRKEVALNAESWDPFKGVRPELIIPTPGADVAAPESAKFEVNQAVRVLRAPYAGVSGTITALRGQATFPGGLRAAAAEVRLDDGASAVLPLANLEVIV
jgi:hypothetical protein